MAIQRYYEGIEGITPPKTSNDSLNPKLSYNDTKIKVKFTGSCLKQLKFTFTHKKSGLYLHCL